MEGNLPVSLPMMDDFHTIVTQQRSLIDTRAPVEFARGSFPGAVNLPLMNDKEREQVGTAYKHQGHDAAVALGYELVNGDIKAERVQAWVDFVTKHPEAYLFCWRGGQRSQIAQEWLHEAGITIPRLRGGYKAFRNYLINQSRKIAAKKEFIVIGGRTGSGKTLLLQKLPNAIDLERLANHRGSSFGRYATLQPTQINFENALAYALIQLDDQGHDRIIIEDESRNIGKCYIPDEVFASFQRGRVIQLEATLEERVEITYDEYIIASQADYAGHFDAGTTPYSWIEAMEHNFDKIRKRLGSQNHRLLKEMLQEAWEHQQRTGDASRHKEWIALLLERYYDPMYDYQLRNKQDRIIFSGSFDEVLEYIGSL